MKMSRDQFKRRQRKCERRKQRSKRVRKELKQTTLLERMLKRDIFRWGYLFKKKKQAEEQPEPAVE